MVAPVARLIPLLALDHRSHGAIENNDPPLEQLAQVPDARAPPGLIHYRSSERQLDAQGRTPSAWQIA